MGLSCPRRAAIMHEKEKKKRACRPMGRDRRAFVNAGHLALRRLFDDHFHGTFFKGIVCVIMDMGSRRRLRERGKLPRQGEQSRPVG